MQYGRTIHLACSLWPPLLRTSAAYQMTAVKQAVCSPQPFYLGDLQPLPHHIISPTLNACWEKGWRASRKDVHFPMPEQCIYPTTSSLSTSEEHLGRRPSRADWMSCMESAAHFCLPSFSGLHQALLGKNCRVESLNTWNPVEIQEDRGFQKAAELHTYTTQSRWRSPTESVPEAVKYDTLLPLGKKNKPESSPPTQGLKHCCRLRSPLPTAKQHWLHWSGRLSPPRTAWKTTGVLWKVVPHYQHTSRIPGSMIFRLNSK